MRATKNGDTRLNINIERAELTDLKRKALDLGITLTKYVRLKLGIDLPEMGKK